MRKLSIPLALVAAAALAACVSAEHKTTTPMGSDQVIEKDTVIERQKAPTRVDVNVHDEPPPPPPPTEVDVNVR